MKIHIDHAEPLPIVRQIVDQMRVHLVNGALKPGQDLIAVRRVAMELRVHFNTVAEAYRQLAEEGWLELRHGRLARVKERTAGVPLDSDWRGFRARMRALVAEMRSRGMAMEPLAADLRILADELSLAATDGERK